MLLNGRERSHVTSVLDDHRERSEGQHEVGLKFQNVDRSYDCAVEWFVDGSSNE